MLGEGKHLGPIGGSIVAEVIVSLIKDEPESILTSATPRARDPRLVRISRRRICSRSWKARRGRAISRPLASSTHSADLAALSSLAQRAASVGLARHSGSAQLSSSAWSDALPISGTQLRVVPAEPPSQ